VPCLPSTPGVREVWLLNCREGFRSLTEASTNRTAVQVPIATVHDLAAELHSLRIRPGGERPAEVWSLTWKTRDADTQIRGIILPHADGEFLRIERITGRQ